MLKKELSGVEVFDLIQNRVVHDAVRTGRLKGGQRCMTQIEIKPEPAAPLGIGAALVEISVEK